MKKLIGLAMGLGIFAANAMGAVISPNDDTYIDESSGQQGLVHDAPTLASAGLFMKNQTGGFRRVVFMEYTIPNVTATAATFNATYFRSATAGATGAFTMQVAGSSTPASFDETTLTWTNALAAGGINNFTYNALGTAALSGGNGTGTSSQQQDVVPNIPISIDILAYFNAHPGETITFKLTSITSSSSTTAGGTLQDREQSRVMTSTNVSGQVPAAPFISYETVPEPAAALLLLGCLPMLRRRNVAG
jgi:hypothetical protein